MSTRADDVRPRAALRHGAYVCFEASKTLPATAGAAVQSLALRLGLRNEFDAAGGDPEASIAYLRRAGVTPGDTPDTALSRADAVIHVAAPSPEPVDELCAELARLLGPEIKPRVLRGVVNHLTFTGYAMAEFAYAHRVLQQPGPVMPNSFIVPLSKTADWWRKDWMERHTYFLPRYDDDGRMRHEGHALAAAAGIPCLLRRTYWPAIEPLPDGQYDFVSYFECADADVPTFHAVCAALRDTEKNPEWRYVREGPTWHGRRVATWEGLLENAGHEAVPPSSATRSRGSRGRWVDVIPFT
jgi:hypothetical protein